MEFKHLQTVYPEEDEYDITRPNDTQVVLYDKKLNKYKKNKGRNISLKYGSIRNRGQFNCFIYFINIMLKSLVNIYVYNVLIYSSI